MRNNKADNTQRPKKLGLDRKRQRQRRVWRLTIEVAILAMILPAAVSAYAIVQDVRLIIMPACKYMG
ncbi:LOW QUALITY PROTEIN: uncharacterized protein [Drosophila kikkawai]|uniref:LOW QUALITY PROTEIN: uncharacterized protein n=1 Tax=Drosophila kikkawai TaxID=30033 RepID=A0A6P4IDW1_DROKI